MPQTSSDAILAVLLGASQFKHKNLNDPDLCAALQLTERRWIQYLRSELFIPGRNILSLFDSKLAASEQNSQVREFLCNNRKSAEVLIVYYAGHGLPDDRGDYYFAVSETDESFGASGLRATVLADNISSAAKGLTKMIIVDACFAASVLSAFQTPDPGGCVLLAAAKSHETTRVDHGDTRFGKALFTLLHDGCPEPPDFYSPQDIDQILTGRLPDGQKVEFHEPVKHKDTFEKLRVFPNMRRVQGGFQRDVTTALSRINERMRELHNLISPEPKEGQWCIHIEDIQEWASLRYDPLEGMLRCNWAEELPRCHARLVNATLRAIHRVLRRTYPNVGFELAVFANGKHPRMITYFDSNGRTDSTSVIKRDRDPEYYVKKGYEVVKLLRREIVDDFRIVPDTYDRSYGYQFPEDAHRHELRSSILYLLHPKLNVALVVTASSPNIFQRNDESTKALIRAFGKSIAADFELFTDELQLRHFFSNED